VVVVIVVVVVVVIVVLPLVILLLLLVHCVLVWKGDIARRVKDVVTKTWERITDAAEGGGVEATEMVRVVDFVSLVRIAVAVLEVAMVVQEKTHERKRRPRIKNIRLLCGRRRRGEGDRADARDRAEGIVRRDILPQYRDGKTF